MSGCQARHPLTHLSPNTPANWLIAACHNGRWELALQNPADLKRLITLLDFPLLMEEVTGTGTIDPTALLRGKLCIKEDAERYALELISLPSGVDLGTIERYLGQKHIDYTQGFKPAPTSAPLSRGPLVSMTTCYVTQPPNNWVTPSCHTSATTPYELTLATRHAPGDV